MSKSSLLPVIACVLVLAAAGANYGLGRLDVPKPHRLPVESFPAKIGDWSGGPLRDVDIDIARALPTAKIVERVYTSPTGAQVDLMLLTATEDEDMHSPQACFPSQGWKLSDIRAIQIDGDPGTRMSAELDGQRQSVLYWLTGYFPPAPSPNEFVRKIAAARGHYLNRYKNMSLFVRLITSDDPQGHKALTDFTTALHEPLSALKATVSSKSESHAAPFKF